MNAQKFFIGDKVRIRPFDEIDTSDIGECGISDEGCFAIGRFHINEESAEGPYVITEFREDYETYIYRMRREDGINNITFWWAQGMLYPDEQEELPDADECGLFGYLLA